ncbi:MAG: bifunctional phosphopantothenoylcysteine decarboxylase/phosphopantothenate--cysteine ligase CoaBC [Deltaproteobacteria bacterium]|nr:bifunctional phosphopantothenoylcysteine decarboxylase/phosphopantothenate--cysteine ligase CoaBC [Deltaproteobacteria bacterium]
MQTSIEKKNIILGVCGGIAAYKSVEVLRLLQKQNAGVRVIMTRNAAHFAGPLTFEALSGRPVCSSLFEKDTESSIQHIDWAREADAVIIAPATANILGKMAGGIADDALSTFLLAVTCPVLVCPSMNTHMYESRAVQRNLEILAADGYWIVTPESGELACGTSGAGRLPEPPVIVDRLQKCLTSLDLAGKKVLVTAGPTREAIDPVRFISNPSSGKMGYAIARAAEHRGADVMLISGPTALNPPVNVAMVRVNSAKEMADAVFEHMEQSHIIIKTAAVSDYRPRDMASHKIKKHEHQNELVLSLTPTLDILKILGQRKENRILVGFAAETRDLKHNAQKKLIAKNLDLIVGNLIGRPESGFGSDTNSVTLFFKDGTVEALPNMDKDAVAHVLLDRIAALKSL